MTDQVSGFSMVNHGVHERTLAGHGYIRDIETIQLKKSRSTCAVDIISERWQQALTTASHSIDALFMPTTPCALFAADYCCGGL